jgi:DNA repair protein RecO (recombination protein O)
VLTPEQGRHGGLYKQSRTAKTRTAIQVGSVAYATWQARLEQHLGTYALEVLETPYIHFMHDGKRLAALSCACYLCATLLAERHPYPALHAGLESFIHTLQTSNIDWPKAYADFELLLLQELGFGLDLTACAVTGQRHSLHFISPRTGRAVSYEAGLPYADKLFVLPDFWQGPPHPSTRDSLRQALAITGYFISRNLMQGRELPHVRRQLCE